MALCFPPKLHLPDFITCCDKVPAPCRSLSDAQLKTVMTFAAAIPPEKRPMFLERVGAMLAFRGRGRTAS